MDLSSTQNRHLTIALIVTSAATGDVSIELLASKYTFCYNACNSNISCIKNCLKKLLQSANQTLCEYLSGICQKVFFFSMTEVMVRLKATMLFLN